MHGDMNPFLTDLYGTGRTVDTNDVEKLAQAEVLDRVLRENNLTLDKLSGDQILKVAEQLFGKNNEIAKLASASTKTAANTTTATNGAAPKQETMEEKTAEADYLGRVMAHAYWQEKIAIEKAASAGVQHRSDDPRVQALIQKLGGEMPPQFAANAGGGAPNGEKKDEEAEKKKKEEEQKTASALDVLANERAHAFLRENGVDPTKQASATTAGAQALDAEVDRRAIAMLKTAGYADLLKSKGIQVD